MGDSGAVADYISRVEAGVGVDGQVEDLVWYVLVVIMAVGGGLCVSVLHKRQSRSSSLS